jgi:hypothetical protein
MKTSQQKNLFSGATEAQLDKISKRNRIEKDYMDFVYSNPNLTMKEYEAKYKSLNS